MIPAQNLKSTARTRRDEKHRVKQMDFAAANPAVVGRSYEDIGEQSHQYRDQDMSLSRLS